MSYMKFKDNSPEKVTLKFDQPKEGVNQFGKTQFTYGVEETILGDDVFSATEKLHGKIQELGVTKGDTIIITKVKKDDVNSGFAFFKVELPPNQLKKVSDVPNMDKGSKNFEKQFDKPLNSHELEMRVIKLEKNMDVLLKWYGEMTSGAGHKPGDDTLAQL